MVFGRQRSAHDRWVGQSCNSVAFGMHSSGLDHISCFIGFHMFHVPGNMQDSPRWSLLQVRV